MRNVTFNDIDTMYRLNARFNRTVVCAYYGWHGHGNNYKEHEFLYVHAKNERFELVVDTSLLEENDDFNYLVLDGKKHLLNEFKTWKDVEVAIVSRL